MPREPVIDRWTWLAGAITVVLAGVYIPANEYLPILSIGLPALVFGLLGRPISTAVLASLSVLVGLGALSQVGADLDTTVRRAAQLLILAIVAVVVSVVARNWRRSVLEEREGFRLLAENASDLVARVNRDSRIIWVSPSVRSVVGGIPDRLIGRALMEHVHPDDAELAARIVHEIAYGTTQSDPVVLRIIARDGTHAWLSVVVRHPADNDVVVSGRRVDAQVEAQRQLAESEHRYRVLAENATDLVIEVEPSGRVRWLAPSVRRILGLAPEDVVGHGLERHVHPADRDVLTRGLAEAAGPVQSHRLRFRTHDGEWRWMDCVARTLPYDVDPERHVIVTVRDVDAEVRMEADLAHQRLYDSLTGLPRRAVALEWISERLRHDPLGRVAVLCVGVNGMTSINEAYTHAAGDAVLLSVAARLRQACAETGDVARVAGDEFVVLSPDVDDADRVARHLLDVVRGIVEFDGHPIDVSASIGIAVGGRDTDAAAILRDSVAAMRQAARQGRDRWIQLDTDVEPESRRHLRTTTQLREALARGEIQPWLMPIVDMATHEVVGFEALARWIHPDGRVVGPEDFVDVAERSGLIVQVDRSIMEQSLVLSNRGCVMSVNVSVPSLLEPDFAEWVAAALSRTGADPSHIHLEVTETALAVEVERTRQAMAKVAELGVHWWVDDFGTGFSSVTHLRDWPVRGLKLDRSFTGEVHENQTRAARLAEGLAGLARGLDLRTVAEGVETVEQETVLREQGWQFGQGWLYGKAAPASDVLG